MPIFDAAGFRQPPVAYRPLPFWSWNDKLDDAELARQAALFAEQGYGGYFMHSRVGLVTPYLSDEWLDRVATGLRLGEELGIQTWIYDEDRWPSGYAGGRIPALGPEYRHKALLARRAGEAVPDGCAPLAEADGYTFYAWTQPLGDPWFDGAAYVDLLNPAVTQAFLDSTHAAYAARLGPALGERMPGFFTDEACTLFRPSTPAGAIPFTPALPARFRQRRGYDLEPVLAQLFTAGPAAAAVRYDYWLTVCELFVDAFTRPLAQWCEAHGTKLTGHLMSEDSLLSVMEWLGNTMMSYEHMHIPGMDHLGRDTADLQTPSQDYAAVLTARQVSSVAHQLGKERALSEMFAGAGQEVSFETLRRMVDWHLVHGINMINPHLAHYSLRGERKRDFPPTLSPQQPWWPHARPFHDYIARLCYALSCGVRQTDVLVLHPIESAWMLYTPFDSGPVAALSGQLEQLLKDLLAQQIDFDLGDEELLSRHAGVAGDRLRLGRAEYRAVLLPGCHSLRPSTLALLNRFRAAGGTVLCLGRIPDHLAGRPADLSAHFAPPLGFAPGAWLPGLLPALAARFTATRDGEPVGPVWLHARRDGQRRMLFAVNTSHAEQAVRINLPEPGAVQIWDALTGAAAEPAAAATGLDWLLPASGSLLLSLDPAPVAALPAPVVEAPIGASQPLAERWQLQLTGPNTLVLDLPEVAGRPTRLHRVGKAGCRLTYGFASARSLPLTLVCEEAERLRIACNGETLRPDGLWWVDTAFRTVPIPAATVRPGHNSLTLEYPAGLAPEACFLLGQFRLDTGRLAAAHSGLTAVSGPFRLEPVAGEAGGDLVAAGHPFLTGAADLVQNFQCTDPAALHWLQAEGLQAAVAEVWLNGVALGAHIWAPYRWLLGNALRPGRNELRLRLTGTLQNLLGPHHSSVPPQRLVHAGSFSDDEHWTDAYTVAPLCAGQWRLTP